MSALDIDWLRPVRPDSPTPLRILIKWFSHNGVVYHASAHQREVLGPLCRELNARGLQCEVDQILDYVSYLQEVVHEAAKMQRDLPEPLKPYQDRLQELLFKDGHANAAIAQHKAGSRASSRLSWLEPSAYSGPSGMEVLVDWLRANYSTYAHTTRKGEKGKMLEALVKEMKDAGIQDCAVNTVRAKIDVLHREVRGEKTRSAAWEQFGSVLEEIFTMGDACQEREGAINESSDSQENGDLEDDEDQDDATNRFKRSASIAHATRNFKDTHGLKENVVSNDDVSLSVKDSAKHIRSSPTSRLSWMKPIAPGSPTAMELLVDWMKRHYAEYTQSTKKGDKGRMLAKLLHKIENVGHHGCTIHAIRVKIDSLQRQAGGKARPSSAFDQYGALLRKVFAEKDGVGVVEPQVLSPVDRQDDGKTRNSDDDGLANDETPERFALPGGHSSPGNNDVLTDNVSTEQADACNIESHNTGEKNPSEVNISPDYAPAPSICETEEGEDQPAVKNLAVPEAYRWQSSPARSPSTSEIVRIATLLRERHDLHQRGVPQEQIDKFLPLPNM